MKVDEEEAQYQAERRKEAIERAKTLLYYQTDRAKQFHVRRDVHHPSHHPPSHILTLTPHPAYLHTFPSHTLHSHPPMDIGSFAAVRSVEGERRSSRIQEEEGGGEEGAR